LAFASYRTYFIARHRPTETLPLTLYRVFSHETLPCGTSFFAEKKNEVVRFFSKRVNKKNIDNAPSARVGRRSGPGADPHLTTFPQDTLLRTLPDATVWRLPAIARTLLPGTGPRKLYHLRFIGFSAMKLYHVAHHFLLKRKTKS
jgi:hypothetical protein